MAIAVASTSTANTNSSNTVTVTAPTGIQVGDLLAITVATAGNLAVGATITPTCPDFTQAINKNTDPGGSTTVVSSALLYKIAVSADTTATDYTITSGNATAGACVMYRITGWTAGNPVYHYATGGAYQDGSTTFTESVSFPRVSQQLILMFGSSAGSQGDGTTFSFGSYQVTSTDANPTWTEVQDVKYYTQGTIEGQSFSAYAVTSNTSTISSYGFAKTGEFNAGEETTSYAIAVIYEPVDASGSNSLISISPVVFTQNAVNGGEGSNGVFNVSPDFPSQSGIATRTTAWEGETASTTSWTNETI